MPKYRVDFADGRSVVVDAPIEATDYDIDQLAIDQLLAAPAPTPDLSAPYGEPVSAPPVATMPAPRAESTEEEESLLLDTAKGIAQFGIGIPRGVIGLGEGVGIGLAALLPEEQELAARDYLKRQAESAREAITPEFYDPEDISSKVGEVLGGTIPFFPAAGAGALAGRALAARAGASRLAGTAAGGAAGAATLGSPAGAAEALERARAQGIPESELTGIAAAGAATGLLEGALPLAMGRLGRLATDPKIRAALDKLSPQELDSVRENLGVFAANAAKSFGIEGSQEFVTAALQNAIAQSYDPEQDIIDMGALEEATLGGTAGAIISAVADIALPGRGRGRSAPYDPKDFEDTVVGSALFDAESGTTAMTTPEFAAQLEQLGFQPELGRALSFEEIYALEKAQAVEPVQELEDRELTTAEQEDLLAQLEAAGIDTGEARTAVDLGTTEAATILAEEAAAEAAVAPPVEPETATEPAKEPATEPEAAPPAAEVTVPETFDEQALDDLGIPPTAKKLRATLLGKAPTDPEAIDALKKYAARRNAKASGRVNALVESLEGAPSEPVAAVSEPDVEPGADAEGVEPAADRVSPADGGPSPIVGRGDGVSDLGVGPEGDTTVAEAPEPGPVEGAGVPAAEPVDGDGAQPSALTPATDAERIKGIQGRRREDLSRAEKAVLAYVPVGTSLQTATETAAYDAVTQENSDAGLRSLGYIAWVRQNGSPQLNARLDAELDRMVDTIPKDQKGPRRNATKRLAEALKKQTIDPKQVNDLVTKVRGFQRLPEALQGALPTPVADALRANDLPTAIRLLTDPTQVVTERTTKEGSDTVIETSVPDTYRALAAPMVNYVGDVQVEVVENLTDDAGNPIAGAYDAQNKRILIDSERGMNPHTLLHELQHPVIDKALREDRLPAVKRLRKIFEELKPRLGDFYAATSLSEFISEVRSNPRLRVELASLTPKGRVSFYRRILNELANIIRAVTGRPTKTETELATPIDKMIFSIMEPTGSDAETFNALYTSNKKEQDKYMDRYIDQYFESGKAVTPEEGNALTSAFGRIFGRGTQRATISNALSFASSLQLSDVFGYFSPRLGQLGRDLHNEFDLQNGSMRNVMSEVDRKYRRLDEWRQKNKKKVRPFDQVVTMSTVGQVDPTKKRNAYSKNPQKLFVYDRMKPLWDRLGPDGQEQWKLLRKHYQDMFADLKDTLFSNIDRYVEDPTTAKNLKGQVFAELFGKAELEVYFPLARQGDYWLTYNMNGERVVEAFNTQAERRAAYAEIEDAGGSQITPHSAPSASMITSGAPSGSFVDKTLTILKQGNVTQDVQDQIVELFINALPETSLIRSMQTRKNRLGAIEDSLQAFKQKGYSLARETLRIKHGNELRSIQNQIIGEIDTRMKLLPGARARFVETARIAEREPTRQNIARRDTAREKLQEAMQRYGGRDMSGAMADALKSEVKMRIDFALSPPQGALVSASKWANRLTFLSFMGFNPASAFVQSGQIPLVSYWATAARTDQKNASKFYATATSLFGSSGFRHQNPVFDSEGNQVGTETVTGTNPSIDNYYIADEKGQLRVRPDIPISDKTSFFEYTLPDGSTQQLTHREFLELMLPMVQLASNRGQLGHSAIFEQLEVNSVWKNSKDAMDVITGIGGVMFHNAEMFNRQVTLAANYLNELHRLNTKPSAEESALSPEERQAYAANEAIYLTQQTNGGSALVTAPRMAQGTGALGPLGRTAMMFKTYGLGMWYHQLKSLRQMLNAVEDPQIREAARKQLVGMTIASVALTGLQGFTLTGSVLAILDMFDLLGDGEDELPAEIQAEDYFADQPMVWTGLINYSTKMMGGELSIAERMGFSNLLIANSRYADKDTDIYSQVGAALLGPSGSLFSNWVKSYQAMEDGEYRRGLELALPAAFANISRSMRYVDEGDRTRLGDLIIDEYTDLEIFGKAFGFSSARRSRQQYRLGEEKGIEARLLEIASRLRQKRNIAENAGDYDEVQRVQAEINEFNDKYTATRPDLFIGPESVSKSWDQFMAGKLKSVGGIRYMTDTYRFAAQDIKDGQSLKKQQTE